MVKIVFWVIYIEIILYIIFLVYFVRMDINKLYVKSIVYFEIKCIVIYDNFEEKKGKNIIKYV